MQRQAESLRPGLQRRCRLAAIAEQAVLEVDMERATSSGGASRKAIGADAADSSNAACSNGALSAGKAASRSSSGGKAPPFRCPGQRSKPRWLQLAHAAAAVWQASAVAALRLALVLTAPVAVVALRCIVRSRRQAVVHCGGPSVACAWPCFVQLRVMFSCSPPRPCPSLPLQVLGGRPVGGGGGPLHHHSPPRGRLPLRPAGAGLGARPAPLPGCTAGRSNPRLPLPGWVCKGWLCRRCRAVNSCMKPPVFAALHGSSLAPHSAPAHLFRAKAVLSLACNWLPSKRRR